MTRARVAGPGARRRMLVIWNGQAGGTAEADGSAESDQQAAVRQRLEAQGVDAEIFESASEAEAQTRIRGALGEGYAAIVAAGGDGTVRSVALELLGQSTPLGILPLGTAMNVANSLGLPLELEAAVEVLATGEARPMDVGLAGEMPFLEVASIGATADVLAGATHANRGRWQAALELLRRARRHRRTRIRLTLDGREVRTRALSLVVANGRYTGRGLLIAPDACPDDGLLDVVVFRGFGPYQLGWHLIKVLFGRRSDPRIRTYRARDIRVEAHRPLSVRADSRDLGRTPAMLSVEPSALQVIGTPGSSARPGPRAEARASG